MAVVDTEPHPLDWTSYLARTLVHDPTPTAMTLMLVAAHFCACCYYYDTRASPNDGTMHGHPSSSTGSSTGSSTNEDSLHQRESSIAGMLFSSAAILARGVFVDANQGSSSRHPCIETPFTVQHTQRKQLVQKAECTCDEACTGKKSGGGAPQPELKKHILHAAMNDPFTMLYDTWSILSVSDLSGNLQPTQDRPDAQHAVPDDKTQTSDADAQSEQQPFASSSSSSFTPPQENASKQESSDLSLRDTTWTGICVLHAIATASVAVMLVPSIFYPSMLACNSVSGIRATAWPVLNCSLLVGALSLIACRVVLSLLRLPQLALCMAMHSAARMILSFANAATACPLPPIAMKSAFASGMGVFLGVLLLTITQMHMRHKHVLHEDGAANTESHDFYMNHAWTCCVFMLGMRHIVFRFALAMLDLVQRVFHVHVFASNAHNKGHHDD